MNRISILAALAVCVSAPIPAYASSYQICHQDFALCAASPATLTGKMITVNVQGGGTAQFAGQPFTLLQQAIDAMADDHVAARRFDVEVGGACGGSDDDFCGHVRRSVSGAARWPRLDGVVPRADSEQQCHLAEL